MESTAGPLTPADPRTPLVERAEREDPGRRELERAAARASGLLRARAGRLAVGRRRPRLRRLPARPGAELPRPRPGLRARRRRPRRRGAGWCSARSTRSRSRRPSCSARRSAGRRWSGSACPGPRACRPRCGWRARDRPAPVRPLRGPLPRLARQRPRDAGRRAPDRSGQRRSARLAPGREPDAALERRRGARAAARRARLRGGGGDHGAGDAQPGLDRAAARLPRGRSRAVRPARDRARSSTR